jgi:lipopolysaccharide export system permease protein
MVKQIDRLMIQGYLKSYFVCLVSLLSLYIVVDLFTNLDDFIHNNESNGLNKVIGRIVSYYGFRIPQFFDRLCEAIVLLAGMFTVAMMQRNNEQLPLLSAGVSTHRIIAPVIGCACFMMTLTILNQELVIPRIRHKLVQERSDPGGTKEVPVYARFEPNLIHVEGDKGNRKEQTVYNFRCTIPETIDGQLYHIWAKQAIFHAGNEAHKGVWELIGCAPTKLDPIPGILDVKDEGRYFLHTRNVDFEALTRDHKWFQLVSTWELYQELQRPDSTRLAMIAVLFHGRLTRPLLGLVLVVMGLSVILRDQTRNVIISSGMCLVLCAIFFAGLYTCKMLGDSEYIAPALAAWMPVMGFGPFAIVMADAVQT